MNVKLTHGRIALLVAAFVAVLASVSYAAIPDANGTISACKDSRGVLKVIDAEAGQTCNANQQLLTWNQQGPAGPQGPPGVARGHANVYPSGSVDGGSLTDANVVKPETGLYCFGGLGFTPQTAVATLGTFSTVPGTPSVRVRLALDSACPFGFRQAAVFLSNPDTGMGDDEQFFILFN